MADVEASGKINGGVGIYAGTFDPTHNGHIAFCLAALDKGLDRVVLLPERRPRNKPFATDFAHRVAMAQLATSQYGGLDVLQLPDEQFTVQGTLPKLQARFGSNITLLLGSDVAQNLHLWQDISQLLDVVGLCVAIRAGADETLVHNALAQFGNLRNVCLLSSPEPYASSTVIREQGQQHLLSDIHAYAQVHGLYGL